MKRIYIITAFIMCLLYNTVYCEMLDSTKISYEQQYGEIRSVRITDGGEYITDSSYNVIAGPFKSVSSYNSFPLAEKPEGGQAMYDLDGTLLAEVGAEGSIHPVANGLYAVSPTVKSMDEIGEFIIYDYSTQKEIGRTYKPFFYYLEEQNGKMFIDRDGKYAIIDKYGNYITDFIYDDVKKRFNPPYEPYPESYAVVVVDGVEKYIDYELNEIDITDYKGSRFITQFYHMKYNNADYKEFFHTESGNMHAIYNGETKEYLIPFQDEYTFTEMNDDIILIKKNDKFGIINYSAEVIVEPVYDALNFTHQDGFLAYRRGDKTGYYDGSRGIEVSDIQGEFVAPGIMLLSYYDYSGEYRKYCTEIKNFAGHNLTGVVYRFVEYKDGTFYSFDNYGDENSRTALDFDRSFTCISLNGKYLPFDGTIRASRTLVPMREIVEGLGGTVDWSDETRTATAYIDGKTILMSIGNNVITVDDTRLEIDVPAQLINEKTMLPVRALCENIGANVDWDERIRCVYINR